MRHHRLQVGEKWRVRTRTGEILRIQANRKDCLVPQWRLGSHISVRAADNRSARKALPALRPYKVNQRDEYAMFFSQVTREPFPPFEICRDAFLAFSRP